jgi:Ran GTPase-activating protein (RanGAP) involved in mRNA processing and transport
MSQRDLKPSDANLIKLALLQNKRLHTLKLGYNHLGDEGLITLSSALASSTSITSLDLGFTGVGDAGLEALANNISLTSRSSSSSSKQHAMLPLQTLYLAGNAIGTRGALALARIIQFRCCHLRTLHLTGNKVGVDGIRSLTRAIAAISSSSSTSSSTIVPPSYPIEGGLSSFQAAATGGIEELFLGGVSCSVGNVILHTIPTGSIIGR